MVTPDIESPSNRRIVETARLKKRRQRDSEGLFLIEGTREVERALDAGVPIEEVFFSPEIAPPEATAVRRRAAESGAASTTVSKRAFEKLTMRQSPDGIVAVASTWHPELDTLRRDLVLVAEAIEKPGNLGAMLRTADAMGADLLIADPTVDVFNPNVVRASQGALFSVPFAVADTVTAIGWAVGHGPVFVATPDADAIYWDAELTGPISIVIGSEHAGVTDSWLEIGTPVRIPMAGAADSLNASVSAAILLSEAVRRAHLSD